MNPTPSDEDLFLTKAYGALSRALELAHFPDQLGTGLALQMFAAWLAQQPEDSILKMKSSDTQLAIIAALFSQGFLAGWKAHQHLQSTKNN